MKFHNYLILFIVYYASAQSSGYMERAEMHYNQLQASQFLALPPQKQGELVDQIEQFLNDPKLISEAKQDEKLNTVFSELQKSHKNIQDNIILFTGIDLNSCASRDKFFQSVAQNISTIANHEAQEICDPSNTVPIEALETIAGLDYDLRKASRSERGKAFISDYQKNALEGAIKQYVKTEYMYSENPKKPSVDIFCKDDDENLCTSDQEDSLKKFIDNEVAVYSGIVKHRPVHVIDDVNRQVNKLQGVISEIKLQRDKRSYYEDKSYGDSGTRTSLAQEHNSREDARLNSISDKLYEKYKNAYFELAASTHGSIAIGLDEIIGKFKERDEFDFEKESFLSSVLKIETDDLKEIDLGQDWSDKAASKILNKGKKEAQKRILDYVKDLNEEVNDYFSDIKKASPEKIEDETSEFIADSITANPAAFAKSLVSNPYQSDLVCMGLEEAVSDKKRGELIKEAVDQVLLISAVPLMLVGGVGYLGARELAKQGLKAGFKQSMMRVSQSGGYLAAGIGHAAVSTTHVGYHYNVAGNRLDDLVSSLELTDDEDARREIVERVFEQVKEVDDLKTDLILEGVFLGAFDGLGLAFHVLGKSKQSDVIADMIVDLKSNKLMNPDADDIESILRMSKESLAMIKNDPKLKAMFEDLFGYITAEEATNLISYLSLLNKQDQQDIINKLKTINLTDDPGENLASVNKVLNEYGYTRLDETNFNLAVLKDWKPEKLNDMKLKYGDAFSNVPEEQQELVGQILSILDRKGLWAKIPGLSRPKDDVMKEFQEITKCKI